MATGRTLAIVAILLCAGVLTCSVGQPSRASTAEVAPFRSPLHQPSYYPLSLGRVKARGWLAQQLRLMKAGLAGRLDELYENVGPSNAWRGGTGDAWERGPYWLDGLVPLAYLLEDEALIQKSKPWIEWTLASQKADGYFGPSDDQTSVRAEAGIQRGNRGDWWPRMVMLKVLQSHYEATGDKRVLELMSRYFRYQLVILPDKPLDHWTHWGRNRGGENQASIYWLFNRTGEPFLMDLDQLVFRQTDDWMGGFLSGELPSEHGVNVAMGLKQPAIQFMRTGDRSYLEAVDRGLRFLDREHGQVQGMFSGDEMLHGTDPTQGTELCTVVELMFSLETLLSITGRTDYADRLELIAYNALPAAIMKDYSGRQYFQQPNQIECSLKERNFITDHQGSDSCFGLLTGYPCCTTNMHQAWPKLVQNLWYATADRGLAALLFGPSQVEALVGNGVPVRIVEETGYPFEETVRFHLEPREAVEFPIHLRVPGWCPEARVTINGELVAQPAAGEIWKLFRKWERGDLIELRLPMPVSTGRWHENSIGVQRGPLVFALAVPEEWRKAGEVSGIPTWEVFARGPWNYGLVINSDDASASFELVTGEPPSDLWNREVPPVSLRVRARRIPKWQFYGGMAGPLPYSPLRTTEPDEEIELIPYGYTKLRISEFPVVER